VNSGTVAPVLTLSKLQRGRHVGGRRDFFEGSTMRLRIAIAATLLIGSLAHAEQKVGDVYAVPQLGYGWPDDDRNARDDFVYGLSVGNHFIDAVSLELGISRGR
jgi:hypothetical protein